MIYMPQILGDEDNMWWNLWHKPVDYTTAKSIRTMMLRGNNPTPRNRVRILAVV
jgi:hypothetical protein